MSKNTGCRNPLPFHPAGLVEAHCFRKIHESAAPYTMTSIERQFALHEAVKFIIERNVGGDFVECGVWRGGSMMIVALTLLERGINDRRLVLYDTFSGMTPPGAHDVQAESGRSAAKVLASAPQTQENVFWAIAPLDRVKENLATTLYPEDRIDYVIGDVCRTLPSQHKRPIAILRLDTDWYASTRCELEYLYPQLQPGGVLIVDDYGYWEGSRRACDEFFSHYGGNLHPIPGDDSGYFLVKGSDDLTMDLLKRLRIA
jgi:O-methyltransferase